MAVADVQVLLRLVPTLRNAPGGEVHSSYDPESDVVYITVKQDVPATDSELTDEDVIVRYTGDDIVGVTILHASSR
ncbi:MAG: DUF2283 domain-containing protein [Chloroflexota bacterium]